MKKIYKTGIVCAIIFFLTASTISFAQSELNHERPLHKNAFKALTAGINSSNEGVAKSSVYMAGFYRFENMVDPLINILKDENKQDELRVLAAYSLYMICDDKAMNAIRDVSFCCRNEMVKGECGFIFNDYIYKKLARYSIRE